ncbi:MAG: HutP family protein [Bacillota bacterium]
MAMEYIGKTTIMFALAGGEMEDRFKRDAAAAGFSLIKGRVGSMNTEKIFAAVETASLREGLIRKDCYRETHALYHATLDAFVGICRGQLGLGNMLRTVGLIFAVAKGPRSIDQRDDGEWLAVVLYGTIGAPIKGYEHETIGLGINHL